MMTAAMIRHITVTTAVAAILLAAGVLAAAGGAWAQSSPGIRMSGPVTLGFVATHDAPFLDVTTSGMTNLPLWITLNPEFATVTSGHLIPGAAVDLSGVTSGGNDGLTSVATDSTLDGDGTAGSQLGLADDAVTADKIAGNAVTTAAIAENAVTHRNIAANAVESDNLQTSGPGTIAPAVRDALASLTTTTRLSASAIQGLAPPSDTAPGNTPGSASAGAATAYARGDHDHGITPGTGGGGGDITGGTGGGGGDITGGTAGTGLTGGGVTGAVTLNVANPFTTADEQKLNSLRYEGRVLWSSTMTSGNSVSGQWGEIGISRGYGDAPPGDTNTDFGSLSDDTIGSVKVYALFQNPDNEVVMWVHGDQAWNDRALAVADRQFHFSHAEHLDVTDTGGPESIYTWTGVPAGVFGGATTAITLTEPLEDADYLPTGGPGYLQRSAADGAAAWQSSIPYNALTGVQASFGTDAAFFSYTTTTSTSGVTAATFTADGTTALTGAIKNTDRQHIRTARWTGTDRYVCFMYPAGELTEIARLSPAGFIDQFVSSMNQIGSSQVVAGVDYEVWCTQQPLSTDPFGQDDASSGARWRLR